MADRCQPYLDCLGERSKASATKDSDTGTFRGKRRVLTLPLPPEEVGAVTPPRPLSVPARVFSGEAASIIGSAVALYLRRLSLRPPPPPNGGF
jgi:hypothetical protein